MARSGTNLGIRNGVWTDAGACDAQLRLAADLMVSPDTADLAALRARHLVYAPLPEDGIRKRYQSLYSRWSSNLRDGVLVFEDGMRGRLDRPDYRQRLTVLGKVSFDSESAFVNSGFMGRFLVWIDYPNALMTCDMYDFSGFCANRETIAQVFERTIKDLVADFEAYVRKVPEEDGQPYYEKLAALYASQELS